MLLFHTDCKIVNRLYHPYRFKLYIAISLLLLSPLLQADTGIDDQILTRAFTVQAMIIKGCLLGSGPIDTNNFGTINFGNISSLNQPIDVTSSPNAGNIIIKCTPNTNIKISLNSGINNSGSIGNGRLLKNITTNETLLYQLFQDINRTNIWGNDINGGNSRNIVATGVLQSYSVYARLFSTAAMPSPGNYTDTVIVTITY